MRCAAKLSVENGWVPPNARKKREWSPILDLSRKISVSKRNIQRWEGMIRAYEKMNEQKKEK